MARFFTWLCAIMLGVGVGRWIAEGWQPKSSSQLELTAQMELAKRALVGSPDVAHQLYFSLLDEARSGFAQAHQEVNNPLNATEKQQVQDFVLRWMGGKEGPYEQLSHFSPHEQQKLDAFCQRLVSHIRFAQMQKADGYCYSGIPDDPIWPLNLATFVESQKIELDADPALLANLQAAHEKFAKDLASKPRLSEPACQAFKNIVPWQMLDIDFNKIKLEPSRLERTML